MLLLPTCLSFGLPVSLVCLSVSQTSMDNSGHKGNTGQLLKGSGCAVSNNLNYDSSLGLLVSVKVIPKFLIQTSVIASKQCVRGSYTYIVWGSEIAKSPTR